MSTMHANGMQEMRLRRDEQTPCIDQAGYHHGLESHMNGVDILDQYLVTTVFVRKQ